MIQILGLREYFNKESGQTQKYDAFFNQNWRAKDVPALFKELETHLGRIPDDQRWNIYYTLANCKEGKREFEYQSVLAFDVDGIDLAKLDAYIGPVCQALEVTPAQVVVVCSGNGLHFLIQLETPIIDAKAFKDLKPHYKAQCGKINGKLHAANLPGHADPSVFEPRRILRMPGTINRKPNREERQARILQGIFQPVDYDLTERSGIPKVEPKEALPHGVMLRYPRVDVQAVEEECLFLKQARDNPHSLNEPQWYAQMSILGRFPEGPKLVHERSAGHRGYSPGETDVKLEQALNASGPRTCESIGNLWPGCQTCVHRGKIKSPILIRGKDTIPTEHSGFHSIIFNLKTGEPKYVPNHEDLRRFFEREHPYWGLDSSRTVVAWDGKHYKEWSKVHLEEFAQKHFQPVVPSRDIEEFRKAVERTNLKDMAWFDQSTRGKINFQNGYYDIKEEAFLPHDRANGFRYVLPYEYDAGAVAPIFEAMMSKITSGDAELQAVLMEYGGYALSNDPYWVHAALVLVGDGANGKSTYLNILRQLAGENNYCTYAIDEFANEYHRKELDGRLFNLSEETPTKAFLDSALFKRLVGGSGLSARAIYSAPYCFTNKAKLILTCNELPGNTDNSHGFARRLIVVPFNHRFSKSDPDYDPHIDDKLKGELPGIFNLMMTAYKNVCRRKAFTDARAAAATREQYQLENDPVQQWVLDNIFYDDTPNELGEKPFTTVNDLYTNFREYCQFTLGGRVPHFNVFSKRITKLIDNYKERHSRRLVKDAKPKVLLGVRCDNNKGIGRD